jgi:hypothetical protein
MRRAFKSVAVCAVVLAFAGSSFAAPRETREQGRERGRESGIVKTVKKIVRALGDGLIVPLP